MQEAEQGVVVITIESSPVDAEQERLREIARGSGAAGHVQDVRGRGPDLVLVDHMDNEAAALDEFDRYAERKRYEAGFGHDKGLGSCSLCLAVILSHCGMVLQGSLRAHSATWMIMRASTAM